MGASAEYERFERSLTGRESPELLRVWAGQLDGADVPRARSALLALLNDPGTDGRLPEALAAVDPEHFETFDALERAVASKVSAVKLGAIRALATVTGVSNVPALVGMLAETTSPTVRQDIVRALATAREGRSACLDAMALDDHRDVRSVAFDALLRGNGLAALEAKSPNVLSMMGIRVRSSLVAVRQEVATQLGQLLAGLDQGRSPIQLGLRVPALKAEADSLRSNLLEPGADLARDGLRAIRGESQRWLQDLALGLLDRGDPRIPAALVDLRTPRGLAALEEWRGRVGHAERAGVEAAIGQLSAG